jgi:hypothetical protein
VTTWLLAGTLGSGGIAAVALRWRQKRSPSSLYRAFRSRHLADIPARQSPAGRAPRPAPATQSSLSDLLLFELDEAPGVRLDDVVEVSNYVGALDYGLARLREGFPRSSGSCTLTATACPYSYTPGSHMCSSRRSTHSWT